MVGLAAAANARQHPRMSVTLSLVAPLLLLAVVDVSTAFSAAIHDAGRVGRQSNARNSGVRLPLSVWLPAVSPRATLEVPLDIARGGEKRCTHAGASGRRR
jgi:hypothetical protein